MLVNSDFQGMTKPFDTEQLIRYLKKWRSVRFVAARPCQLTAELSLPGQWVVPGMLQDEAHHIVDG
jgi:hypothetical protein